MVVNNTHERFLAENAPLPTQVGALNVNNVDEEQLGETMDVSKQRPNECVSV